jgi:hypothetical protein
MKYYQDSWQISNIFYRLVKSDGNVIDMLMHKRGDKAAERDNS